MGYIILYFFANHQDINSIFLLYYIGFLLLGYLLLRLIFNVDFLDTRNPEHYFSIIIYTIFFICVTSFCSFLPVSAVFSQSDEFRDRPLVTFPTVTNACSWKVGEIKYFNGSRKSIEFLDCNKVVNTNMDNLFIALNWDERVSDMHNTLNKEYFLFDETALFYGYNRHYILKTGSGFQNRYFSLFILEHLIYCTIYSVFIFLYQSIRSEKVRITTL